METTINIKDIVANGTRAVVEHITDAVVYYRVDTEQHSYLFPIDMNNKEDVGTTTFKADEKAITLMRYIRLAVKNNSLIQLK